MESDLFLLHAAAVNGNVVTANEDESMENEQQTHSTESVAETIRRAARDAAEAAIDAHGEAVAPHIAWDFIQQVCDDTEGEVYGYLLALSTSIPREFEESYELYCQAIILERRGSITTV